jgi:xanthine dehydrogenase FAD-binding subunit
MNPVSASFKTVRPSTLSEALQLMSEGFYTPFAGGTDLMIRKRQWQGAKRRFDSDVIFIQQLKELQGITINEEFIEIGAGVTQREVAEHKLLPDYVKTVVSQMATPAIRQAATMGGNVVNAASVADTLPLLIALDAQVVLKSCSGERRLLVSEFVIDKYKTLRAQDELLTSIVIPTLKAEGFYYKKVGNRRASILSKLSVFILWTQDDLRVAIGAINDSVIRSRALEEAWLGDKDVATVLLGYQQLMASVDDKRSTKAYREKVVMNILREQLTR